MPSAAAASDAGGKPPRDKGDKDKDKESKASAGKKKSQRPSWSCTECTRRKIRCDRVVPGCNQCIKRNKVHLCRLDQDAESGFGPGGSGLNGLGSTAEPRYATATEYEAVLRSVGVVRQRLHHLDRIVNAFVPQAHKLDADGQPSWAIDMNRLAGPSPGGAGAKYELEFGPPGAGGYFSGGGGFGSPSVGPTPAGGASLPLPYDVGAGSPTLTEQYEPANGFRIEGMTPLPAVGHVPLPPPPGPGEGAQGFALPPHLERVREEGRQMTESDGEVEAAVTLEFLALGRDRKQDHFSRAELRRPSSSEDEPTSPALAAASALSGPGDPSSSALFAGHDIAAPTEPPSGMTTQHPSPAAGQPTSAFSEFAYLLPDRQLSDAFIDFSIDRVGWQHAAVHAGQFRAEIDEFFSWGGKEQRARLVNQAWLALYFAMLCAGVKHMSVEDSKEYGVSPDHQKRLPKLYFDASVAALHRANFLAKHSIYAVQSIVVLVIACQDVGGSDLIATLLACAIRIAQHLNLHRFASDQAWDAKRRANGVDPKSAQGIRGLIQREVRKRVWYALCAEDWYSIPYRRAYAIFPSHITTPPPLNCHDSDLSTGELVSRSQDEPTVVSKILIAFKVAASIRNFFEHVNSRADGDLSYETLLEADREIRRIINEGPAYLSPGSEPEDGDRLWLPWFRRYWIMSVSHKLLICHRVFLGRAFRDPEYAYSRKAAIEASRSIVQELERGKGMPKQDVWTVPYHIISAATTIILDIFQTPSSDPDGAHKRHEVGLALEQLRLLDSEGNSQIAARGVQLLTTLLAEEAKHRRPAAADLRKRKMSEVEGTLDGPEAFGDLAKRVVSNSRTPLPANAPPLPTPSFPLVSPSIATATFPYFAPTAGSSALPHPLSSSAAAAGGDHASPVGSHVSDASLTQDAFDAILHNLGAWSANPTASGVGGEFDASVGMSGVGGSPGTLNVAGGTADSTLEFWRAFDSNLEAPAFDISTGFGDGAFSFPPPPDGSGSGSAIFGTGPW
ncbi:hypothetical protein JCM6882_008154 [Rhodosporidiobolus microsporus]